MPDLPTTALSRGHLNGPRLHDQDTERDYWDGLIDEQAASTFLGLTVRCLQGWRYKGGGPPFVRVSARCIRYRRCELREFADARLRTSTSDSGAAA